MGVSIELILLALYVYTPVGHLFLGTESLPATVWGPLLLGAVCLLLAEELRKCLIGRFPFIGTAVKQQDHL